MRIGIDLARVGELDRLTGRAWFRGYVFAPSELSRAEGYPPGRTAEFLTGRFAAKEAVLKVLGTGLFEGVLPREIEVERAGTGEPVARLTGAARAAADRLGLGGIRVSIAHKGTDVVAVAIGEPA
jgi:holo-[acyl-carrier protein] synthase